MDLQLEELHSLTLTDVLRESISIPRASPRTFALLTLTLVFPLSFAVLAHTLFTHPILHRLATSPSTTPAEWAPLLLYQFAYLLFLFVFSLLSTGAAVFTVASLYAGKPVSFRSTLTSIPTVLPRLLRTFLWVSLLMLIYNLAFAITLLILLLNAPSTDSPSFFFPLLIVAVVFLAVHVYISAWWHLASVVSVLEPVYGLAALSKSRELLRGRVRMAAVFVAGYLMVCGLIGLMFRVFVVKGPDEEGSPGFGVGAKVVIGGALVAALVVVNLVGLLVQSVFYYVCKSYHHQMIDKSALFDHLGGYLGEYVPLKSSIQMENL